MDSITQLLFQNLSNMETGAAQSPAPNQHSIDLFQEHYDAAQTPTDKQGTSAIGDMADNVVESLDSIHTGYKHMHNFMERFRLDENGNLPGEINTAEYTFSDNGATIKGPASNDLTGMPEAKDVVSNAKRLARESREFTSEIIAFNSGVSKTILTTTLTGNVASKNNKNLDMLLRGQ